MIPMNKQNHQISHLTEESSLLYPASSISTILSNSLSLVEPKIQSNLLPSSGSASSVLLDLRQQQINQLKQIQSTEFLPFQTQSKRKGSELHDQISKSEICWNEKQLSIVQHSSSAPPKQINKAKKLKREKGEAYKDRSLDRYASKTHRKMRMDKLKHIY